MENHQQNIRISFKQAKQLVKYNFDWHVNFGWLKYGDERLIQFNNYEQIDKDNQFHYPAPTLSEVQRWLWEKFGIYIEIKKTRLREFCFIISSDFSESTYFSNNYDHPSLALKSAIDKVFEIYDSVLQIPIHNN